MDFLIDRNLIHAFSRDAEVHRRATALRSVMSSIARELLGSDRDCPEPKDDHCQDHD